MLFVALCPNIQKTESFVTIVNLDNMKTMLPAGGAVGDGSAGKECVPVCVGGEEVWMPPAERASLSWGVGRKRGVLHLVPSTLFLS